MAGSNSIRVIKHDTYDGKGFTNENTLAYNQLTRPAELTPTLIWLMGAEDKRFPLTFLTEGQTGGAKYDLDNIEYTWNVIKRLKKSDAILKHNYGANDTPGANFLPFYVTFETEWLKQQHTVVTTNGVKVRIQNKPIQEMGGGWTYKFILVTADPAAYMPLTEMVAGLRWGMEGGANVSQSYSVGNESNKMMPGKMKNQLGIVRKSYEWAGNVQNKMVEVEFNVGGSVTSKWMKFEAWQHHLNFLEEVEENAWWSVYNRLPNGTVTTMDEFSNLPVPMGAGLVDQIPNHETYGTLTASRIKNIVGDIFYGMSDTQKMNVVLYTGLGGLDAFDIAMKAEAVGLTQIIGDKFVTGNGRNLSLGGFFTNYEHIDGHTVSVRHLPLCDYGVRAEISPKHKKTGRPLSSYDMFFVDHSTYNGERNIKMVCEKGRIMKAGILKGMTSLESGEAYTPMDFSGNNYEQIATDQDKSSIHFMRSMGVAMTRANTSFWLSCDQAA